MKDARSTLVIGHRGASGYRPEHTASAYRIALAQGADAVEPDVVPTKDGVLIVRHENEISTTTDVAMHPEFGARKTTKVIDGLSHTGWFAEDFTWVELQQLRAIERLRVLRKENRIYDGQESILRLADVLRLVDEYAAASGTEPSVVIEMKHAAHFAALGYNWEEMIRSEFQIAGWHERSGRVIYECFELGILEELQTSGFPGTFVFLLESKGAPADEVAREQSGGARARTFAWYRTNEGLDAIRHSVDGIGVAKRDLFVSNRAGAKGQMNDLVARAHARNLLAYTWTLRPENFFLHPFFRTGVNPASWGDWEAEFGLITSTGIDGVFVDHPDLGVSVVRSTLGSR